MRESLEGPIHFVGIGGSGMAGLAELALADGFKVQGSDLKQSDGTQRLKQLGVVVVLDHQEAALGQARTLVYSSAINLQNVELQAARTRQLRVLHRSEFLAYLMAEKKALTIAGTHGKSTTSAMVTYMLDRLRMDPSAAIGGTMRAYGSAARVGKGAYFVAEADESDGSFLKYRPLVGVITNVAPDHMEFFKNEVGLVQAFKDYLGRIDPNDGVAVIGWDNPLSRLIGSEYTKNRLTYGFLLGSEVRAVDFKSSQGETTFTAMVEKDRVSVKLPMLGKHNAQNALCSLAVARSLGLDVEDAAAALAEFPGVDRRLALVHSENDLKIFDDYAHNPGKIQACVQTLKDSFPEAKLHVVFQAHRYSRLETMYDDMLGSVGAADFVHVVPVYAAGETTKQDFSPGRLAADLTRNYGVKAFACMDLSDAVTSLREHLRRPAVILTVGAGDIHQVATTLKNGLP